ncbi:MAG TPA: hypothetical protein VHO24_14010 [Opitutaceae bacterium]|nr:hypothetical protein [Opitutaceae bacterium]
MKTNTSLRTTLLSIALLGLTLGLRAQDATMAAGSASPATYGLIGEEYTGVSFGYTHHVDGPPRQLRGFGFIANRPVETNLDAAFKYDYTGSSLFGQRNHQHRVAASATYYLGKGSATPFLDADAGWIFQKFGGVSDDGFTYLVGAGVEFQVLTQLVVTPFVNYQDVPSLDSRAWGYGAKATYRLAKEWSASFRVRLDEDHNVEYRIGVNRHF